MEIDTTIPPIGGNKSITDFIISDCPMDLKVTHYPDDFPANKIGKMDTTDKIDFAKKLYEGADSERSRKQAAKAKNNWGLNRLYVLVSDTEKWFSEPEKIVRKVISQLRNPQILQVDLPNSQKEHKDTASVIVIEA